MLRVDGGLQHLFKIFHMVECNMDQKGIQSNSLDVGKCCELGYRLIPFRGLFILLSVGFLAIVLPQLAPG